MGDPRRERFLEEEIARMQEEKIEKLKESRTVKGAEKAACVDRFNEIHKAQGKLESELETLREDD